MIFFIKFLFNCFLIFVFCFVSKFTEKPFDHTRGWQAKTQGEEGQSWCTRQDGRQEGRQEACCQSHRKEIRKFNFNLELNFFYSTK